MMISSLRCQARRLTLFLGVVLALLHGPVEFFHHAFHAQAIAAHSQDSSQSSSAVEASPDPCPFCALAALPITLPVAERLLSEPCTQPTLVCLLLSVEECLRRSAQRFHSLRAPPEPTC